MENANTQIQPFIFNSNQVRIKIINDTEYFCAKDVCDILGYSNNRDAIEKHCKLDGVIKYKTLTNGGTQELTFLNQENLVLLVAKCNLITQNQKRQILQEFKDKNLISINLVLNSRKEIEFFDILEKILEPFDFICKKQYQVLNHRIDFYIQNLNIAIEYDEKNGHSDLISKQNDEIRQVNIENEINCKFIRVSDSDSHLWNCGYILKNLFTSN